MSSRRTPPRHCEHRTFGVVQLDLQPYCYINVLSESSGSDAACGALLRSLVGLSIITNEMFEGDPRRRSFQFSIFQLPSDKKVGTSNSKIGKCIRKLVFRELRKSGKIDGGVGGSCRDGRCITIEVIPKTFWNKVPTTQFKGLSTMSGN